MKIIVLPIWLDKVLKKRSIPLTVLTKPLELSGILSPRDLSFYITAIENDTLFKGVDDLAIKSKKKRDIKDAVELVPNYIGARFRFTPEYMSGLPKQVADYMLEFDTAVKAGKVNSLDLVAGYADTGLDELPDDTVNRDNIFYGIQVSALDEDHLVVTWGYSGSDLVATLDENIDFCRKVLDLYEPYTAYSEIAATQLYRHYLNLLFKRDILE